MENQHIEMFRHVSLFGLVPVCASIISERRCVEVFNAMKRWYAMGEKEENNTRC